LADKRGDPLGALCGLRRTGAREQQLGFGERG
jgi:hypothetical protein